MQQDANGNVTALVNTSGSVVKRYVYQPFGTVSVYTSSWTARSGTQYDELYLFQGERHDWTAADDNFYGRVYRASLQIFISPDPEGFAAGFSNFYLFVGNNPVNLTDPSGLDYRSDFLWATPVMPSHWQVHHTKQQALGGRYQAIGIDVHDVKYLRAVPRKYTTKSPQCKANGAE